jgi:hypothetical protein
MIPKAKKIWRETNRATKQVMHDFGEYLRAYWVYVSTSLGLGKALAVDLMWVAGLFVPLGAKTILQLPSWLMLGWMAGWALLSNIFAPFGMWKHHRAQIAATERRHGVAAAARCAEDTQRAATSLPISG